METRSSGKRMSAAVNSGADGQLAHRPALQEMHKPASGGLGRLGDQPKPLACVYGTQGPAG